jgi:sugar lactone lactonase YvrE
MKSPYFPSIVLGLAFVANRLCAVDLPDPATVVPVEILTVPGYCEGVVFGKDGSGYISWGKSTGKLIARYAGGNLTTSNVAFGGPDHDQLFVTGAIGGGDGRGGLFRLDLKVPGLMILPR